MDFGEAIAAAKRGQSFRMSHWKEDVTIQLQVPDTHSKMTHAYLYAKSRYGLVPWIPTMVEILSEDWEVLK